MMPMFSNDERWCAWTGREVAPGRLENREALFCFKCWLFCVTWATVYSSCCTGEEGSGWVMHPDEWLSFAHKVIATPSVRSIFIQSVALILPYVVFHIPLMQLHLQLRVSGFLGGFQTLACALEAIIGHPTAVCRTVGRVCSPWHVQPHL